MLDTVRRFVEAGREALTPKKAEELARALVKQGSARTDQVKEIAGELVEWSKKSSERFAKTVRREVSKQMEKTGVATKDDVEALKQRIRQLESAAKTAGAPGAASRKRATSTTAVGRGRPASVTPAGTSGVGTPMQRATRGRPSTAATPGGGGTPATRATAGTTPAATTGSVGRTPDVTSASKPATTKSAASKTVTSKPATSKLPPKPPTPRRKPAVSTPTTPTPPAPRRKSSTAKSTARKGTAGDVGTPAGGPEAGAPPAGGGGTPAG